MKNRLSLYLFLFVTSLCHAQNPILWGYTLQGGQHSNGIILNYNIATAMETDEHNFAGSPNDGQYPYGVILKASNGLLYGLTYLGGAYNDGTIFSYNISTGLETDLHDFGSGTDGERPLSSFIQASNGLLYGMTGNGGVYNNGTLFSYNISTGIETDLFDLDITNGFDPTGTLIQASNGLLYGLIGNGGTYGEGLIFSYNISNSDITVLHNFGSGTDGKLPLGSLIQASNGLLYGMTEIGGTNATTTDGGGIIFSYNITTGAETVLHNFGSGVDGREPFYGNLIQVSDSLLYGMTRDGGSNDTSIGGDGTIFNYNISTGVETVAYNFGSGTDGKSPAASLIQASNGLLYGMTQAGGIYSSGIIFNYNITIGIETDLHDFGNGIDGKYPWGSLIEVDTATIYVAPVATICEGGSVTLVAYGSTTYTWAPATGLSATTGDTVIATPTVTTTYTVTGAGPIPTYPTTVTVTVNPVPVVTVNTPAPICSGTSTALTASGGTTYTWAPVAGLSSATGSMVTATPTATTTYTVIGSNGICADTTIIVVTVNENPTITVSPSPASYCPGGSSTLKASGGNTYTWSPLTGLSETTGSSVTANPTITTTYSVTGTNSNGCSTTNMVTVTVNTNPTITASPNPASYCVGGSSTLTALGGNTYMWSPSINLSATTGSSVTANPTITTTYIVTGTNSNGCSATNTVTVTVNPNPTITASPSPASYCNGGSSVLTASGGTTYTWSPLTGLSSTTGSSITANPTVTNTYTVTGKNSNGCSATNTVTVTVKPTPVLNVPTPPTICNGSIATLTASGANTYTWAPATGLSAVTGSSITANPTITTTYTVAGMAIDGCSDTTMVTVSVSPVLVIGVAAPLPICIGGSDTLAATGANGYVWSPATGLSATSGSTLIANPTVTTTYTITGTSSSGCMGVNTVTVTVNPNPTLSIITQPQICNGESTTLTATGGTTYLWSPSAGLSSTTGGSVIANPTATTIYLVTGTASGNCTATAADTVTIIPAPPLIIQPQTPSVCPKQSIVLNAPASGSGYIWSPASTLLPSTGDTVTATPTATTTYTVIGIDSLNCAASGSDVVYLSPVPDTPTITHSGNYLISSATQGNQWLRNDSTLQGATNQSYLITIPGTYSVITQNPANGCSSTSDTAYYTTTGIEQLTVENGQLTVYPNPTGGEINIVSSSNIDEITITNLLGQLVYESQPKQMQYTFNLKDEGMYFVTVTSENETQTKKVLVIK